MPNFGHKIGTVVFRVIVVVRFWKQSGFGVNSVAFAAFAAYSRKAVLRLQTGILVVAFAAAAASAFGFLTFAFRLERVFVAA